MRVGAPFRVLSLAAVLAVSQGAWGSETGAEAAPSGVAFHAWAGLGVTHPQVSGNPYFFNLNKLSANFGLDLGYRFLPAWSVIGLVDYERWMYDLPAVHVLTLGAGIRYQAAPFQFVLGGGLGHVVKQADPRPGGYDNIAWDGWSVRAVATCSIWSGLGPYLQLGYSSSAWTPARCPSTAPMRGSATATRTCT